LGNKLFHRALSLFCLCWYWCIQVTLEHPWGAYSWKLPAAIGIAALKGVKNVRIDMCSFPDPDKPRTLKPTKLLTTQPWIDVLEGRCTKDHSHDPPLTGKRCKDAARYRNSLAQAILRSYAAWRRSIWKP
jgi:hypothetical protein